MKAFACHFSFEFMTGLRNRSLLLMNYLLPLGFYALMGALMTQLNPFFREQLIPAMVAFATLSGAILGLPTPLVEAREAEVLRSYRINCVPEVSLLAIPALATGVHIAATSILIAATGPLFFNAPLPIDWPAFLLVFLSFLFACTGLGSLIGVIAGNSRSAILWEQMLYLPSMILGGLMIPAEQLPTSFIRLSRLLPTTYAMDAFRGLAWKEQILYQPVLGIGVLLAGGFIAFALASCLFAWDKENRKKPILAALALLPYLLGALLLG